MKRFFFAVPVLSLTGLFLTGCTDHIGSSPTASLPVSGVSATPASNAPSNTYAGGTHANGLIASVTRAREIVSDPSRLDPGLIGVVFVNSVRGNAHPFSEIAQGGLPLLVTDKTEIYNQGDLVTLESLEVGQDVQILFTGVGVDYNDIEVGKARGSVRAKEIIIKN